MKKLLIFSLLLAMAQFVLADGHPVLKANLKGGLSGRLISVISDMKERPGVGSKCMNYVQQKILGNMGYENLEVGSPMMLDMNDYSAGEELLEYAKDQISNNHLKGEVTKEVPDSSTGCKRTYVLTWNALNKYGDKGSIYIIKLDDPTNCPQSLAV